MFFAKTNPTTAVLLERSGRDHHVTVHRIKRWTGEGPMLNTILTLAIHAFLIVHQGYSHESLLTGIKKPYQLPSFTQLPHLYLLTISFARSALAKCCSPE